MAMKTLAFFNNKGGVGKTSLVYHLAWMYADLGLQVVVADLDPQANLSAMFLDEDRLEQLWPNDDHANTVVGAVRPIQKGTGDIAQVHIEEVDDSIGLVVGDLALSGFEDKLSDSWPNCSDGDEAAFRVMSAFYRLLIDAARQRHTDLVLVDIGPNLGAINRAVLIAASHVVTPMAPDLFSLQGLRNLGPTLRKWRIQWDDRRGKNPEPTLKLPSGSMRPVGYVVMQHAVRLDRPVQAYGRWMARIPHQYRSSVINEPTTSDLTVDTDTYCLAQLKHYRSLMPMAMEARKPMFALKAADGAIGAHLQAVQGCFSDFRRLATTIAERCRIEL
jgi:cellulose biosynthesis protein BcsQ